MTNYRTRRSPLRTALRRIRYAFRKPAWIESEENECEFYAQFIPWGGLCFDIGANCGDKTNIFHLLGAHVVAVDPVPDCVLSLRRRFPAREVTVVDSAVGAESGDMPLHIGDSSTISSLLPDWIQRNPSQLSGRKVSEVRMVPVTTLDALILKYGIPAFCKIDVEGYEAQVLAGVSHAIPMLSYEWTKEGIDQVGICMKRLEQLGNYEFNFSYAFPLALESESWMSSTALMELLRHRSSRKQHDVWGDVFARLR